MIAIAARATRSRTAAIQIAASAAFGNRAGFRAGAFQIAAPSRTAQIARFRICALDIAAPARTFEVTARAIGASKVASLVARAHEIAIVASTSTSTSAFLRGTAPKPDRASHEPDGEKSKDSFYGHGSILHSAGNFNQLRQPLAAALILAKSTS